MRIIDAVGSEEMTQVIYEVNQLPSAERRRIAAETVALMDQAFASGNQYHNGRALMAVLPALADDDILAKAVRPYLKSVNELDRGVARRALCEARGPASGELMLQQLRIAFERLPLPPYRTQNSEYLDRVQEDTATIGDCIKGLLRSDSEELQKEGRRYLQLYHRRHSRTPEGLLVVTDFDRQLKNAGIVMEDGGTTPPASTTNSAATEPSVPPMSYPTPPSDTPSPSGLIQASKRPASWIQSSALLPILGAAGAALLALIVYRRGLRRRR